MANKTNGYNARTHPFPLSVPLLNCKKNLNSKTYQTKSDVSKTSFENFETKIDILCNFSIGKEKMEENNGKMGNPNDNFWHNFLLFK